MKTRSQSSPATEEKKATEANKETASTTASLQQRLANAQQAVSAQVASTIDAAKKMDKEKAIAMGRNAATKVSNTTQDIANKSGLVAQDAPGWQIARSAAVTLALTTAYDYMAGSTFRAVLEATAAGAFGFAYLNQSGMLESVKPTIRNGYEKASNLFSGKQAEQVPVEASAQAEHTATAPSM